MVASSIAMYSCAGKFELMKYKFIVLRDNLKIVLEYLSTIEKQSEDQIQCYQIMHIKTNFFIDEMDFHLRGDVNPGMLKEYFAVYINFYQRSKADLSDVVGEICPNRHLVW
uniref:Uncharacterized protein n=1 Tax=Caenorhabditis japonica TaxID=281687 RepID=A0A8R1I8P2_CAEJA